MTKTICALLVAALVTALSPAPAQGQRAHRQRSAAITVPLPEPVKPSNKLITEVTLADIGFASGLRFSNLGGRREIFVPLPQGNGLSASQLVLLLDDISAHEARRSLEILVNDRSATAIALDGRSMGREVRVSLARAKGRAGFVKLTFVYSGAATQDRCIDVRSIGDSLTIRPESGLEVEVGSGPLDPPTVAALMPRDVAIVLSDKRLGSSDLAAALTIGRALKASGRRVSFQHGFDRLHDVARRDDPRRWTRGLVLVGDQEEVARFVEFPQTKIAGPASGTSTLAAVRVEELPAILVSDSNSAHASRLFGSSLLPALQGVPVAAVGDMADQALPSTRVTFDQLALAPASAEVFGRADITFAIATRMLPRGTKPTRLMLDLMVAPDGAGEKAVVSVFVDERLLGSAVASIGEPTRFDLGLPDGLVGSVLNVRVLVQRRSAQVDCRFEPQGYPAQVLGSSAVVLTEADATPRDFANMAAWWASGIEVWLPSPGVERPAPLMTVIADTLATLSPETAPIAVNFTGSDGVATPTAPFIAVSNRPPAGTTPRVRFDRGRVVVADRSGRTLLDLAGFTGGAVAQIVSASGQPGLWLKPLASDGTLPAPATLRLDRGDVAFVDNTGVALAMSSERDRLVRIAYPEEVSWLTIAERFHTWIIGAIWVLVTAVFLFGLQRMLRRRGTHAGD